MYLIAVSATLATKEVAAFSLEQKKTCPTAFSRISAESQGSRKKAASPTWVAMTARKRKSTMLAALQYEEFQQSEPQLLKG
jgi:hypothetical protein